MKKLLTILPLLCLACPLEAAQPTDPYGIEAVLALKDPRVSVIVRWEGCGEDGREVNAFYDPRDRSITMCTALIQEAPQVIKGFFAHELGHATIQQLELPITGSEETAADEFATYTLLRAGDSESVEAVAKYFWDENADVPYYDPHPDDDTRAFVIACQELGWEMDQLGVNHRCVRAWRRLNRTWSIFLDKVQ